MRLSDSILSPPDKPDRLFQSKCSTQSGVDVVSPFALSKEKLVVAVWIDMEVLAVFLQAEPFWKAKAWRCRDRVLRCGGHVFFVLVSFSHGRAPLMPALPELSNDRTTWT